MLRGIPRFSALSQLCYQCGVMRRYTNKSRHVHITPACVCLCVVLQAVCAAPHQKKTRWGYLLKLPETLICFFPLWGKSSEHVLPFSQRDTASYSHTLTCECCRGQHLRPPITQRGAALGSCEHRATLTGKQNKHLCEHSKVKLQINSLV